MLQGPPVCLWAGVGFSRGGTSRGMYSEGQKMGIHGTWHNPYPDDQGGCILPRKRRAISSASQQQDTREQDDSQDPQTRKCRVHMRYAPVVVRSQWSAWRPTDNCSGVLAAAARGSNRRTTSSQQSHLVARWHLAQSNLASPSPADTRASQSQPSPASPASVE